MPPKKGKKKNDDFEDYFFGEAEDLDTANDNVDSKPSNEEKAAEVITETKNNNNNNNNNDEGGDVENRSETSKQKQKDKKKNKKKGGAASGANDVEDDNNNDDAESIDTTTAKESHKKEDVVSTAAAAAVDSDDEEGGEFKKKEVKSAAEKKAEKKKRDAEKRRLEKQKEEERLRRLAEQQAKKEEKSKKKQETTDEAANEEETTTGKGGKKKEKGGAKSGLGAAAKKALQEELDRKKAEEERIRKEQEEMERLAEEMRRQQEEKERLERERKEKKKQRKKEEIAKQKSEGTYLTKTQKEERARMELAKKLFLQNENVVVAATTPSEQKNNNQNQQDSVPNKRKSAPKSGNKSKEKIIGEEGKDKESMKDGKESENGAGEKVEKVLDNWEDVDDWEQLDDKEEEAEVGMENGEVVDGDGLNKKMGQLKIESPSSMSVAAAVASNHKEDASAKKEANQKEKAEEESESSDSDDESSSDEEAGTFTIEEIKDRIKKRRLESDANKDVANPRSPVVCVLGHVDTGKTKILDKIRRTNVQDGEAGGITQQIGATNMPQFAITQWGKSANVKDFDEARLKLPGFLVIDTPGHESFTNLRSRGSSLCDLAILVVDIMHGLEPQTLESIKLLKDRQAPFVIALNKIDRLFEWKANSQQDIRDTIKKQKKHTREEFETRLKQIIAEFAEKCELNVVPFWENEDPATYVSICPTSAHTGDGMGNMIWYMVNFCQNHLKKRLAYRVEPQATVLEVKEIQGLGTTIDIILVNGKLKVGKPIIIAGYEGPIETYVKALLVPPAMKELRVKSQYEKVKQIRAATGVKILAKDVEKALAGMPMLVASRSDETEVLKEEMQRILAGMISSIKLNDKGVYVQASTLGSLEALLEFLKQSQIPYSGINIGPVHKKDVMKATTMLEHNELYGVILAFDVKVERDAQELAESTGIKIFTADIIYHLFDKFQAYKEELKQRTKDKHRHLAVFPCKLRILPNCIFNTRDPIIIGVTVEAGVVKSGTHICVPSKEGIALGTVASIESNNKPVDFARQGSDVCLKIENTTGEAPKLYGRHFDSTDILMSKLTRESIDALKDHFRDEMTKTDWLLVKELKGVFKIV